MIKQIIIARKDINMSPGKLAAQVSHASMAFLTTEIQKHAINLEYDILPAKDEEGNLVFYKHPDLFDAAKKAYESGESYFRYKTGKTGYLIHSFYVDKDFYEGWLAETFTKVILEAKNKNQLLKAKKIAEDLGMKEGEDFFLIKDCCRTELEPEEIDENGVGRTLTCIGFKPMKSEIIDQIGKKYQLMK